MPWSMGGSSVMGVKLSMPKTKISTMPMLKLRSPSVRGSRNGRSAVALCTMNAYSAMPAIAAQVTISAESNQSARSPRSSINCALARATASMRKPSQSRRVLLAPARSWMKAKVPSSASSANGTIM